MLTRGETLHVDPRRHLRHWREPPACSTTGFGGGIAAGSHDPGGGRQDVLQEVTSGREAARDCDLGSVHHDAVWLGQTGTGEPHGKRRVEHYQTGAGLFC